MENMHLFAARAKRAWKKAGIACRNLPLTITGLGVLTCVELFTAGGIIQSTPETVSFFGVSVAMAALEIGVSYGCGILSFLGSGIVADLRADPRPSHQGRAGSARWATRALLIIPIIFFTNALALQVQKSEREQYVTSETYALHQQMAHDYTLDSVVRAEAAANLERAAEVKTARIDGTWFLAFVASVFVYGTLSWAGTALHKPAPETPHEARERYAAQKRARERQRRQERHAQTMQEIKAATKSGKVFDLRKHLQFGRG